MKTPRPPDPRINRCRTGRPAVRCWSAGFHPSQSCYGEWISLSFSDLPVFLFSWLALASVYSAQDDGVAKALEGLPDVVRQHVVLAPSAVAAPKISADDPLGAALVFAGMVSDEPDVRNRLLDQCARQAVKRGATGTAREIAARITDYRAALLLIEIAEEDLKLDPDRARDLLQKAAGMVRLAKPWQGDLVLAQLIVLGTRLEVDHATLAAWWNSFRDEESRLTAYAGLLVLEAEKSGRFDLARLDAEIQKSGRARPAPGLLPVARQLFVLALPKLNSGDAKVKQDAEALVDAACAVLRRSNVVHAELLLEVSAEYFKAGHEAISRRLFELAEAGYGAPHEEMARLHYRLALLWQLRGREQAVRPLTEAAELKARSLEQMYRPFALAWIAAAWAVLGETERSDALNAEAARDALTNVNPRMRLAGAVDLCLTHAQKGRHLSPAVVEMAESLLRSPFGSPLSGGDAEFGAPPLGGESSSSAAPASNHDPISGGLDKKSGD